MSVMDVRKEIGAICDHILRDHNAIGCADIVYTRDQRRTDECFLRSFPGETTLEDYRETAIKAYFNRVAIANELAIMLTYSDRDCTVHGLNKEDIKTDLHYTGSHKKIYDALSSISYNLVANSGSMMFSADDEQILNNLIAHFAYQIIRDVDRVPA